MRAWKPTSFISDTDLSSRAKGLLNAMTVRRAGVTRLSGFCSRFAELLALFFEMAFFALRREKHDNKEEQAVAQQSANRKKKRA